MDEELRRNLREFQDYIQDVQQANHLNLGDRLTRFVTVLGSETPLGRLVERTLPEPQFDSWYERAMNEPNGMGGQRRLVFPTATVARVALQLELIRRVDTGKIDFFAFCHTFLTTERKFDEMVHAFAHEIVRQFSRDLLRVLHDQPEMKEPITTTSVGRSSVTFIDAARIQDLQAATGPYDLRKLVRLCEELNECYRDGCYFAVAMLTRAVLDHVPPIFGYKNFAEVVSNYPWGRSRKDAMDHLDKSARKIADVHLHTVASSHDVLPNRSQVNFDPSMDVLLGEIVKILSTKPTTAAP